MAITKEIQEQKLAELKREIQRKANIAHKRLKRLEKNNLTELPAYKQWVKEGAVRFGVRGKTPEQLQQELNRVNRFLESKTSLVREANKYLKETADIVGVKYKSVKELPELLSNFFRLSDKVEEYLRLTEGSASAIGYHKIWEVVNEVVEVEEMTMDMTDEQLEQLMAKVIEAIGIESELEALDNLNWTGVEIENGVARYRIKIPPFGIRSK